MRSIFFVFVFNVVTSFGINAQVITTRKFLQEYTDSSTSICDNCRYWAVELNPNSPASAYNWFLVHSVRNINDKIFITDIKELANPSLEPKFFRKYFLKNNYWKLSPVADNLKNLPGKQNVSYQYTVAITDTNFIHALLKAYPGLYKKMSLLSAQHLISIFSTFEEIEKLFLNQDAVVSIDATVQHPKEELAFKGFDLSANTLNTVHRKYPSINGAGQHVSIKENYYDTTDIDLKGRLEASPLASNIITNHANIIATIIAGAGNSFYYAKGAAWNALISSSSFDQVLPEPAGYYKQNGITVQNHSYGTGIDNTYGLNAAAFDKSENENADLLHVFSSGNSGTASSTAGNYSGIPGFANLTGDFKMAKNVILVGAVDSFGAVAPFSSRGPAYDGRIKPEIVAFEKNGTSESAALVSGATLLLQQYYRSINGRELPSTLAKSILINTADDVYNAGPDYATGFGNLNAIKAMNLVEHNTIFEGIAQQGNTDSFPINVPQNISKVKVTLTWNDTAASAFAPRAIINDLDLSIVLPAAHEVWQPWVLSSYPDVDSLNALPQRKRDSLNNVEQVTIDNPLQGNYFIHVTGFNLPAGPQKYYAVYTMDSLDTFKWSRPVKGDFFPAGQADLLRWENTFSQNGTIEFSYASAKNWNPVASNVDLTKKYFEWTTPDTIAPVIIRMKIGNTYFYSDTFLITKLLNPKVGIVCNDSILLYWNKIQGINLYQLYRLGEEYMEPMIQLADTSVLISTTLLRDKFVAVAPVLSDKTIATRSYALDYTLQGAGCFINDFQAYVNGNHADLTLSMGSVYQVAAISFEKQTSSGFVTVFSMLPGNQLEYTYDFNPLSKGITYFRAKITLTNGQVIYSAVQPVFYVQPGSYLLLPVPVKRNSDVSLYTTLPDGEIICLYDATGRTVLQKEIVFTHEIIETSWLQPGIYFYAIWKKGVKVYSGKLIIL